MIYEEEWIDECVKFKINGLLGLGVFKFKEVRWFRFYRGGFTIVGVVRFGIYRFRYRVDLFLWFEEFLLGVGRDGVEGVG